MKSRHRQRAVILILSLSLLVACTEAYCKDVSRAVGPTAGTTPFGRYSDVVGETPPNSASADDAGNVSLAELQTLVKKVRAFKPRDQFDVGPKFNDLVGKRFSIAIKPEAAVGINHGCSEYPGYWYDTDKAQLNISYGGDRTATDFDFGYRLTNLENHSARISELDITCHGAWGRPYRGQTALGVTAVVDVLRDDFIAFGALIGSFESSYFSWHRNVSPEEARSLAPYLRVRIVGRIGEWFPGQPVICGTAYSGATLEVTTDGYHTGCFINAVDIHVELVDARSDTVLNAK